MLQLNDNGVSNCCVCGSGQIYDWLNLGKQPIANSLLCSLQDEEYFHTLQLSVCHDCTFVQIVDPIPDSLLYEDYKVTSICGPTAHLHSLVARTLREFQVKPDDLIVDVGSNDGYLLALFKEHGHRNVLGIEPALNCASLSRKRGVLTLNERLSLDLARGIVEQFGHPKVIFARHVLEHITRPKEFMMAIKSMCGPNTILVVEVPDLEKSIEHVDYSVIFEQHINYFTLPSLRRLLIGFGLQVMDVVSIDFFSGSMLAFTMPSKECQEDTVLDDGHCKSLLMKLGKFRYDMDRHMVKLKQILTLELSRESRIAAYGAGQRGTSLINYAGIGDMIEFVVDKDSKKHGKWLPGCRLPIRPPSLLSELSIKRCLLTALGYEKEVISENEPYLSNGGCFIKVFPLEFIRG